MPADSSSRLRWYASLRITIALLLTGMVGLTALVLVGVAWRSGRTSSLVVSHDLMTQATRAADERIGRFLEQPSAALSLVLADLQQGALDPWDNDAVEARFYNTLKVFDALSMMAWADEDGDFLMVRRMPDGALWTKSIRHDHDGTRHTWWTERRLGGSRKAITALREDHNDTFDPRTRPWYRGAKAAGGPYWTDVYVFFTDHLPGVTAAVPWVEDGHLQGVLAVDVSLGAVSRFLHSLHLSQHGEAFLLGQDGRILAAPDAGDVVVEQDGALALHAATDSHDPALAALAATPDFARALEGGHPSPMLRVTAGGQSWIGAARPVGAGDSDWWVAMLAPEGDFLGAVQRLARSSLLAGLLFGLATVLVSLLLSRRIATSLERLVEESGRVRALQFDDRVDASSPFREVHEVLSAFEGMKIGLRSLQKYLPMRLVRVLLEAGEEPRLGADLVEVTLMFSDIEGFTTISEALGPSVVATRLGDYLGRLTRAIQAHNGTVTQYIGDGIMALWGAPLPVPDQAQAACHAVLDCRDIVRGLWADEPEVPRFRTRFGLHTAQVAVGHFGTEDRIVYTAMGDGVNLASRLEGLCKHYGVEVLVSEETWRRVQDAFEARRVDFVRVKGKREAVGVYELLGEKGTVHEDLCRARDRYEAGLRAYRERRWSDARGAFLDALSLRPDDAAAEQMIARCDGYATVPPPDDWTGAHTMTVK